MRTAIITNIVNSSPQNIGDNEHQENDDNNEEYDWCYDSVNA